MKSRPTPLQRAGLKATSPRMHVLEAFRRSDRRHLSAEDVCRILLAQEVDAGLSTVYRVLNQLVQADILLRHTFEADHAVFELNEGGHHDHLICVSCGRVEEFRDEGIEQRQRKVAARESLRAARAHAGALWPVPGLPGGAGKRVIGPPQVPAGSLTELADSVTNVRE